MRTPEIGGAVIFTDPDGIDHHAVCTNVFGEICINVAYVSGDAARTDTYGRQLERSTSVLHQNTTPAHGYSWRFADEERKSVSAPSTAHALAQA